MTSTMYSKAVPRFKWSITAKVFNWHLVYLLSVGPKPWCKWTKRERWHIRKIETWARFTQSYWFHTIDLKIKFKLMLDPSILCLPRIQFQIIINQSGIIPKNLGHFLLIKPFSLSLNLINVHPAISKRLFNRPFLYNFQIRHIRRKLKKRINLKKRLVVWVHVIVHFYRLYLVLSKEFFNLINFVIVFQL